MKLLIYYKWLILGNLTNRHESTKSDVELDVTLTGDVTKRCRKRTLFSAIHNTKLSPVALRQLPLKWCRNVWWITLQVDIDRDFVGRIQATSFIFDSLLWYFTIYLVFDTFFTWVSCAVLPKSYNIFWKSKLTNYP